MPALVLGASGSVGQALLAEILRHASLSPVVTLVRRSQPEHAAAVRESIVSPMNPATLEAATAEAARTLDGEVLAFSVLGVGAGTAKLTLEEHRAVDVALNAAFARGLKASGRVKHLAFMSAAGADPASGVRYARVKGESEEAVKENGPSVVSIFRPALIIGSQHTPWVLEKVLPAFSFMTPAKYKSITVDQIAKAMVAASLSPPTSSTVNHYDEMVALSSRASAADAPI